MKLSTRRSSFEIKVAFLMAVSQHPVSLTRLCQKVNTSYITIKNAATFLEKKGLINLIKVKKYKRIETHAVITEKGREFLNLCLQLMSFLGGEENA